MVPATGRVAVVAASAPDRREGVVGEPARGALSFPYLLFRFGYVFVLLLNGRPGNSAVDRQRAVAEGGGGAEAGRRKGRRRRDPEPLSPGVGRVRCPHAARS